MKKITELSDWQGQVICFVIRGNLQVKGVTRLQKIEDALRHCSGSTSLPFHIVFSAILNLAQDVLRKEDLSKIMLDSTNEDILGMYKSSINSSIFISKLLESILDHIQFSHLDFEGSSPLLSKMQRSYDLFEDVDKVLRNQS